MNVFFSTRFSVARGRLSRLILFLCSVLLACYSWTPPTYSASAYSSTTTPRAAGAVPIASHANARQQAANALTPQLFFPVVYHLVGNNTRMWNSTLLIQNPNQAGNASIQLAFYNAAGQAATPTFLPTPNNGTVQNPLTLAPGATATILLDPPSEFISGLIRNTPYAVVVNSDLPLAGVNWVRVKNSGSESHGSYAGFTLASAASVYLPAVAKAANSLTSNLAIQNLSNSTLNGVTLNFYDQNGNVAGQANMTAPALPAYAAWYPDLSQLSVPTGFSGSLVITSPNGPVAVVDNKIGGANGYTLFTYSGLSTTGPTRYAPFLSTQNGASATLTIQNPSNNQSVSGAITHSDNVGNMQFNLPARGSQTFTYNAGSHNTIFAATINASQPVVALATQQTSSGSGSAYEAVNQGSTSYRLPLLVKGYQNTGSSASFQASTLLFNPGQTATQVQLRYSNGNTSQMQVLNPGQYLSLTTANEGALTNGFIGAATLVATQPIFANVGVVGQGATGDLQAMYSGITPAQPAVNLTKSANVPYLKPGDALTYTLTFAAGISGGSALIADLLPSQLLSHTYSVGAGVVVTPTGNVDYRWAAAVPAAGGTIAVSGIVDPALVTDLLLVNTAAITANNSSATSSANVIVDTTPPDTTISNKPADPSNDATPSFFFSANDGAGSGVASFQCQLDSGSWSSCNAAYAAAPLSDGPHTIAVRAVDQVGFMDASPATYGWTIDTTPPAVPTLLTPAHNSTIANSQSVTLTWQAVADADLAGYQLDFNGQSIDMGAETSYPVGPLANGVYTWTIAAYDTVSNRSSFASIVAFTIDANVPQVLAFVPPANSHTVTVTTPISLTFSQAIAAATVNTRTLAIHAMQSGQRVQTYSNNGATVSFIPQQPFKPGELVQVSANGGLQTGVGIGLLPAKVWRFRTGVGGGSGQFTIGNTFGNNHATDGILGDVDGDGDLDLLVGNYGGQSTLYLNDGDGTFDTTAYPVGSVDSNGNWAIAFGDVDGDGDLDLALGNDFGQGKVYLNDGVDNPFDTVANNFGTANDNTIAVAFGDVDGDGDLDLIQGCWQGTTRLRLHLNNGDGAFALGANEIGSGYGVQSLALGDVNLDGRLDLLVNDSNSNVVYLNDGENQPFDGTSYRFGGGAYAVFESALVVGDLDGDGDLDLITTQQGANKGNTLYLNDGTGNPFDTTTSAVGPTTGLKTTALALGDVDGDGDLDVITGNWASSGGGAQNLIYLNDGTGHFPATSDLGVGGFSNMTAGLDAGDLDGDGDLDIAEAVWGNTAQISYLNRNEPLPVTPTPTETPDSSTTTPTPSSTAEVTLTPTPPTATPTPTATVANCPVVVSNTNDSGAGSLRQALSDVGGACTQITFAAGLTGQTIRLAAPLTIAKDVTIDGSGRKLTISGDTNGDGSGDVAVFTVNAGRVTLSHLTIAKGLGSDGLGGGVSISPDAQVNIVQSTVRDNISDNGALASAGGGIYNTGILTLTNSTVSGNQATNIAGLGGGIHSSFGSVTTIRYSTITGNSAPESGVGGGLNVEGGAVTLIGSIVSGNNADSGAEIAVNNGGALTVNGHNVIGVNGNAGMDGATPGATDLVPGGALNSILNPTLADNGGDSTTHELVVGGPAHNAIPTNSLGCGTTITQDQRGVTRPASGGCDSGAVESTTAIPTPTPTLPAADATTVAQPNQPASLTYNDPSGGGVAVQIPAGAIDQPTTFLYADQGTPSQPGAFQFAGRTFTLTAYRDNSPLDDFTFQQPVTLVIDYTDSDVAGIDENTLTLFFYDEERGIWSDQGIIVVTRDPTNNRLTVQIPHLTEFAMGATQRVYMPVVTK